MTKSFQPTPKYIQMEQTQSRREGQIYKNLLRSSHLPPSFFEHNQSIKTTLKENQWMSQDFEGNSCNTEMRWWDVHGLVVLHPRISDPANGQIRPPSGGFPYNQHHFWGDQPTNQPFPAGFQGRYKFAQANDTTEFRKSIFLGFFGRIPLY